MKYENISPPKVVKLIVTCEYFVYPLMLNRIHKHGKLVKLSKKPKLEQEFLHLTRGMDWCIYRYTNDLTMKI